MADISNYLKTMLLARFGRDVRQTIHDAINAVNSSAEGSAAAAETAKAAAERAKAGAETARTGAETARRIAESYAVGTYGQVREEDVTDNAKSYSEQSKNNALLTQQYYEKTKQKGDDAINAINKAFDNINQGLPRFVINPKDGKLYCTPSRFTFVINRLTGNLEWGLTL